MGTGLTADAAADFGLNEGTAIGAGLIDAHAGGLGTVGARGGQGEVQSRMAYVFGTSACTMSTTADPAFVPGVWGPYRSAMVPGMWLNEGGQSAAGAAIDQLVQYHPASAATRERARTEGLSLVAWLAREAERRGGAEQLPALVGDIHVVPEFLGNRSPFADPDAKALIAGLGMDGGVDSLVGLYLAGIAGLGYGVRQIIEAQGRQGISIDTIVVSGGAARSPLVRQILADATGIGVAATAAEEPVLAGASILGALAGKWFTDASSAMAAMTTITHVYEAAPARRDWHTARSQAYNSIQDVARAVRRQPVTGRVR